MEKELINKKTTKKQWKKFLKTEEFVDHFAFYRAIQMSAKSMIAQMIDFLFMDEIYIAFLELLELNNNILAALSYEGDFTFFNLENFINQFIAICRFFKIIC